MKFISCQTQEQCDVEVAGVISQVIHRFVEKQEYVVVGIPGGRSVSGIFKLLKDEPIPWGKVHIFMVDERMVPITDSDSNFKLAKDAFLTYLVEEKDFPEENIHPFDYEAGIENYQDELERLGGRFDVILLSAGEDGHVGGLFPKHHSVEDKAEFFLTMDDSPKPPPERMTMSAALLGKSSVCVLLFYGEGKRKALEMFQDDKVDSRQCPAKLVKKIKEVYISTDNETKV